MKVSLGTTVDILYGAKVQVNSYGRMADIIISKKIDSKKVNNPSEKKVKLSLIGHDV